MYFYPSSGNYDLLWTYWSKLPSYTCLNCDLKFCLEIMWISKLKNKGFQNWIVFICTISGIKTWHGEADVASYRFTLIDGCTPTENSFNPGECYEDSKDRILPKRVGKYDDNQSSRCIAACKGYKYAGMQNTNECYCGNILPTATLQRPGECPNICPGNANEKCGGRWRMNIYDASGEWTSF